MRRICLTRGPAASGRFRLRRGYLETPALRAYSLANRRYPVSRVWSHLFGLRGLSGRASGSAIGMTARCGALLSGSFRRVAA
jgi:hypothetical protein